MMSISINVTGNKEIQEYLIKVGKKMPKVTSELCQKICNDLVKVAKEKAAPFDTGSGALVNSIHASGKGNNWMVSTEGIQSARPQHAYYQEYGFAPHRVKVSNLAEGKLKRSLEERGIRVITVRHYFPYMSTARRRVTRGLRTDFNRFVNKVLKK